MLLAANEIPLALAFAAGLVATVNPCGFAMLPSLLSFYLGAGGRDRRAPARVAEGLAVGLMLTAGFMLLFSAVGIAFALGAQAVVDAVPWATIGVGAALVALGGWLLAGRHLIVRLPGFRPAQAAGYLSMFAFGVAYAVGSLSCTLPIFLVVVSSALATGSPLGVVLTLLAYGLGMSTILMLLCLGTAGFRELLVRVVRPLMPHMSRISGALLVLGGGYVVYYWASLLEGSSESVPIRFVQDLQQGVQELVTRPGDRVWLAVGSALLFAATLSLVLRRGRGSGARVTEQGRRTWAESSGSRRRDGKSASEPKPSAARSGGRPSSRSS